MPTRLTFESVKRFFSENGCSLKSTEYISNRNPLVFICKCGHNRTSCLTHVKTWNQFMCKKCTINPYIKNNANGVHPLTFAKTKKVMETKYSQTLKYRADFLDENYNKKLTCWDCKETKNRRLFPYRKQYADNKEKRCKRCNRENGKKRVRNHTLEQTAKVMVVAAKASANKRRRQGRELCGIHTITVNDILTLKQKQNNKCAYSGRELVWERKHHNKASIDRINSSFGYIKSNIQLVCRVVNQFKSDLSDKEFKTLIYDMYQTCHAQ